MIEHFLEIRNDLETLKQIAVESPCLHVISSEIIDVFDGCKDNSVPVSTAKELRTLMGKTQIQELSKYYGGDGIAFTQVSTGLATGGTEKGYLYTSMPPKPLVSSLDDALINTNADPRNNPTYYLDIGEGWYLYLSIDR